MKHAGPAALDTIEDLLAAIRGSTELRERSRGVFYDGSRAFLHFHEDPEGLFADLKEGADFVRYRVTTAAETRRFLASLARLRGRAGRTSRTAGRA